MRFLTVAPNWIGDALLAQPLFARLQQRLPGVELDVLAPAWTAPVLERMPEITQVISTTFKHGEMRLGERWNMGRALKSARYDQAIVLPNNFKSALIPFFADIPLRTGYVGESRYGLLNILHKLDEAALPLMAERYAQLAEAPGDEVTRPLAITRLRVDEINLLAVVNRLALNRKKPVAVFCPGAEYGPAKRWPVAHFAELARRINRNGFAVWLLGSDKDRAIGEEIAAQSGIAINLCGLTNLAEAMDLMSVAQLVVCNDSGLMHVAAALRRPLIALYGSSSAAHTPPLAAGNVPARLLNVAGLECRPCFQRECPLGHFRCMNDLLPERVLQEIMQISSTPQ